MATPKSRGHLWSPEDEAQLKALLAANVSITRIAVRLGRKVSAIKTRLWIIARREEVQSMPKGSKGEKAKTEAEVFEGPPEKRAETIELGRRGNRIRAENQSAERRAEMVQKATEKPSRKPGL